tara:strand:+ start:98 stop:310 length:213 start_codon:yes stop_codon:yes gene_type:complete
MLFLKNSISVDAELSLNEALHRIDPVLEFAKYTLLTMAIAVVAIVKTVLRLVSAKDFIAFLYCILMIKNN